ncbi:MAG: PDZ domain-containing protein, partial [Candidatus Eisenbacteria bacterium]|nr:PDZ domain-containing protein [Candidatus Eisenbacteria bacterium]
AMEYGDFAEKGLPVLRTTVCVDTVERPWVLVVPDSYDPGEPTPLLVNLHGGVGRAEVMEDPLDYVTDNDVIDLAGEMGWIALVPFGQTGATWWDDVGMSNIRNLVRTVKSELNVDDDRVWMIGFSDGASAGFAHAMVAPNDYAAFVALNGHIGVGSLDGDLPTYAPNIANTPVYATTTFDDGLYPSERMRPTIEMAREAGGDVFYRELPGQHDFEDVKGDLPAIARFLERHPRNPFPHRIVWEAARPEFGACRWLAIDRVSAEEPAPWHTDHNVALIDDRITVGFFPKWDFEGTGIFVEGLSDGESAARSMGLKPGDVIVEADGAQVDSLAALDVWKEDVERGDSFEMTVLREGERVTLEGSLAEESAYFVFKRESPSAKALASFCANTVDIQASRLGACRVLIHPDMFRLEENIVVRVNGETVYDDLVRPDLEFMLRNFAENRDRSLLYVAELPIELP